MAPERAGALLSLPDAGFLAALQHTFGDRLGNFIRTSRPVSYPLGLNADTMVAGRRVAIGNAAQTLHPVAGQGLNLGLRDAVVLARLLGRESSPAMLARFAAERSTDRSLTVRLTDTMATVFTTAARLPLPQSVLGLSLGLLDVMPPVKRLLAEQMMFGRR
jgi:2-octaprenyl-6-methoxyphenol hydroxylase